MILELIITINQSLCGLETINLSSPRPESLVIIYLSSYQFISLLLTLLPMPWDGLGYCSLSNHPCTSLPNAQCVKHKLPHLCRCFLFFHFPYCVVYTFTPTLYTKHSQHIPVPSNFSKGSILLIKNGQRRR